MQFPAKEGDELCLPLSCLGFLMISLKALYINCRWLQLAAKYSSAQTRFKLRQCFTNLRNELFLREKKKKKITNDKNKALDPLAISSLQCENITLEKDSLFYEIVL